MKDKRIQNGEVRRHNEGEVNDGGPAFPSEECIHEEGKSQRWIQNQGMSLRAAAALTALPEVMRRRGSEGSSLRSEEDAAKMAVDYADALLEELDA